jgi:hypothetical protein
MDNMASVRDDIGRELKIWRRLGEIPQETLKSPVWVLMGDPVWNSIMSVLASSKGLRNG